MSRDKYLKYAKDPGGFMRDVFGVVDIFDWQKEVIDYVVKCFDNDNANQVCQVAIAGGNNVGKSFFGRMLLLWHFATQSYSRNFMMTNSERQTKNTGFYEIKGLLGKAFDGGVLSATEKHVCFADDGGTLGEWDISFFLRVNFESGLTGLHFPKMFFLLDECLKFPDFVWKAIETMTISGRVLVYACANPLEINNGFFRIFQSGRGWFCKNVSLLDIPDKYYSSYFVENRMEEYGVDAVEYRANVLGLFPTGSDSNVIFPFDNITNAFERADIESFGEIVCAVDVAVSEKWGSVNAVCVRSSNKVLLLESFPMDFDVFYNDHFLRICEQFGVGRIVYDSNGVGVIMARELRKTGLSRKSYAITSGAIARDSRRFSDIRSELAWDLSVWLRGDVFLPDVHGIGRILSELYFVNARDGRLQLVSKGDLKKALVGSKLRVDLLDCLLYSFLKDRRKNERSMSAEQFFA